MSMKCKVCEHDAVTHFLTSEDYCVSHEVFEINKCSNCGFAYTVNAPSQNEIGRYYEHADYISHTDTKEGLFFKVYHAVRNYMLGQKLGYIKKQKAIKSILDIGAGTGYFVNYALSKGIEVKGVEPDADARTQAHKNFNFHLLGSLQDALALNRQYDAISMWHVLEHVHELDAYFEDFRKLLNEKGILCIAVPNYTSFDAQHYGKYWAAYDLPKHLWHFSPTSMKILANKHSFRYVQSYAMPFDPFYIALLRRKNKGGGFFSKISAFAVGKWSFIKGFFNAEKASSVVYVFEKS
ncbi:MAG: class I SAM-dependent methyltransferase [Chitinophagales bacterium]|nr:class I SAM-dependent methyltransferase [Chitinophagales bacterium]